MGRITNQEFSEELNSELLNTKTTSAQALGGVRNIVKIKNNVLISGTGWVNNPTSGLYEYNISDSDITSSSIVDVNIKISDLEKAKNVKSANDSSDGSVKIYSSKPLDSDISCDLKIVRQVL